MGVVSLDSFAAAAPKKPTGLRSAGAKDVLRTIEETEVMRASGDWVGARPRNMVALYVLCHRHVYGVDPLELSGKAWTAACLMAARIIANEFDDDVKRCVAFLAWTWSRERRAHAHAAGAERRRLGWRLQFSAALLTDYRVHLTSNKVAG